MKILLRDAGIALSLANILFYSIWSELLPGAYGHYYLMNPPTLNMNLAMLAVVSLTALAFFFGGRLTRRSSQPHLRLLGKAIFLIVFLFALNGVRSHLLRYSYLDQIRLFKQIDLFLIRPFLLILALLLLTKGRRWIVRAVTVVTLVLLPFAVVTLSQAAWACVKTQAGIPFAGFEDRPAAPLLPTSPGKPRVLWLLFDGLDQNIAFEKRPEDVALPHLDDIRRQSLYASAAHSPGGSTLESLPSLLMGARVAYARPVGVNTLRIQFDNTGQVGSWGEQPSVFTKAREMGCNSALLGYYHPYSRVIGHHVAHCFWRTGRWDSLGMDDPKTTVGQAMSRILAVEAQRLLSTVPFIWRFGLFRSAEDNLQPVDTESIPERIGNYLAMLEESKKVIQDPAYQLIFIHWPVPHPPFIYDREKDDFNWAKETSYEDNLELVDRTMGEVLKLLQETEAGKTTTFLITSDHPRISRNHEEEPVPFLLHMPGQTEPLPFEKRWDTVAIPGLTLAILSGQVSDPQQAAAWLDRNTGP